MTLMGQAEDKAFDLQKITETKGVFVEDLTPEQKAQYFKQVLGVS